MYIRHPDLTEDETIALKDMFSYARRQGWLDKNQQKQ